MLMRSPDALTASASSTNEMALTSPAPRSARRRSLRLRPTPRYYALVDLLYRYRCLTDSQIQFALFTPGNASGCQRTLTRLTRAHWIDRLPRRSINEPYVYTLSAKSTVGNRLMRDKYGVEAFKVQMFKPGPLEHFLAVNDLRLRVEQACQAPGWNLDHWARPEELAQLFGRAFPLIPDAYFRVSCHDGEAHRVSGHFVELQHALKSHRALLSKWERYRTLFQHAGFVNRSMVVLVVFTNEQAISADSRIQSALKQAERINVSFVRFASLDAIRAASLREFLTAPIWWQPGQTQAVALFGPEVPHHG